MAVYSNQKLANETVIMDDNEYTSCEFQNCQMIYRGGGLPKLQHCHFTQCAWHLEEAAQRTVLFLRGIYHSGPGGRDLVEETLRHIRVRALV